MGDDFREEYTDLKKHGIPFCAQECTFFGFFRLTLSLSKAYVAGSSIWARRTRNQHEIYVASCCTSWIQVHCCGTKMNCIGKKTAQTALGKILRPPRLLWSWPSRNRGLWSWSCGWWPKWMDEICRKSIWKLERVEAPANILCINKKRSTVSTSYVKLPRVKSWGIERYSSFVNPPRCVLPCLTGTPVRISSYSNRQTQPMP